MSTNSKKMSHFGTKKVEDWMHEEREFLEANSFWSLRVRSESFYASRSIVSIIWGLIPFIRTEEEVNRSKDHKGRFSEKCEVKTATQLLTMLNVALTIAAMAHCTGNMNMTFRQWWAISFACWVLLLMAVAVAWVDPPNFGNPWSAMASGVRTEYLMVSFLYYDVFWMTLSYLWWYSADASIGSASIFELSNKQFHTIDTIGFRRTGIVSFTEARYFASVSSIIALALYSVSFKLREHTGERLQAVHVSISDIKDAVGVSTGTGNTDMDTSPVYTPVQYEGGDSTNLLISSGSDEGVDQNPSAYPSNEGVNLLQNEGRRSGRVILPPVTGVPVYGGAAHTQNLARFNEIKQQQAARRKATPGSPLE